MNTEITDNRGITPPPAPPKPVQSLLALAQLLALFFLVRGPRSKTKRGKRVFFEMP